MAGPRRDSSGKFLRKDAPGQSAGKSDVFIDLSELAELQAVFLANSNADVHDLLDAIGQQQEDAARRRLTETKTAPDGTPWAPWSERYAKTRRPHHSLLEAEGHLADSMGHNVIGKTGFGFTGAAVDVGASLEYAAVHLYGSPEQHIPARPYLDTDGKFADPRDAREISDITAAFMAELLKP